MRSPGRREIGHGKLAWRAIRALLPDKEEFPYNARCVGDYQINGSSSMATVCSTSLSLMDAEFHTPACAGIAMGLIKRNALQFSDILDEHLGDMDFKVAGTEEGILFKWT